MFQRSSFGFFGLLIFSAATSLAQVKKPPLDFSIHQEYTSTRALGMGNAFTAVADDHSAMFYNPAALAFRENGTMRAYIRGGWSLDFQNFLDDLKGLAKNGTEQEQIDAYTELLMNSYGESNYFHFPDLGFVWVRPNWGFAFIPMANTIDFVVHQQFGPQLTVTSYSDTTLAYSYAKKTNWFPEGHKFAIGGNLKLLHRIYIGEAISVAQLASDVPAVDKNNAGEGATLDLDIGTMWVPPWNGGLFKLAKPTFAMVMRNSLDYGFPSQFNLISETAPQPPNLGRRLDFGSNWSLPKLWVFDPHFALDVRDVLHENWSIRKGFHAGAELYWKMYNWWKGYWSFGVNQGYLTAGFGARMALFQLDISTWADEVGTEADGIQSRRYMLEMSLEF